MSARVLLIDPRYSHNVSQALRSCALLGATELMWTGGWVPEPEEWPEGSRLPREERQRIYRVCALLHVPTGSQPIDFAARGGYTPVCFEKLDTAQDLRVFTHPRKALYVFGPENGSVPKGIRHACHQFVRIPVAVEELDQTPFNLSHSVAIALYSRLAVLPSPQVSSWTHG